jgi:hypothetical protein
LAGSVNADGKELAGGKGADSNYFPPPNIAKEVIDFDSEFDQTKR